MCEFASEGRGLGAELSTGERRFTLAICCQALDGPGGSDSTQRRQWRRFRLTPSGRRSPGAGWRTGRRSYLPGRDERSEERSGRSRSRGGGRCRFVEEAQPTERRDA